MEDPSRKRPYYSPRRQEQARETRQRILTAARRLFTAHGYVATTLPAIAREAGVSPATITVLFGTKQVLLDALIKSTVRGDDTAAPVSQRDWWQEMLCEPDPRRQLALFAAIGRRIHEQTTDIAEIVRGAAAADRDIAAMRQALSESRLQDVREVAESLADRGALATGTTLEQATDQLWVMGSSDIYRMLVVERGWTPEQYEQWLASSLICSLLGQHGSKHD
jgi:TetR/AcrR family transcriptional regulator, regulator of autoinduction and epiphytic fitness